MWFVYALLGAFGKSYSGYFRKKIAKSVSGGMYIWVSYTLILVVMGPFMAWHFDELLSSFINIPLIVVGAAIAYMLGTQLNLEALKREDLSYTAPLNAFVPVFTLLVAGLFLSESPPRFGIAGIVIIVVGAYIISIKPEKVKWYSPLKRMFTSTGAVLSLCVALCYAVHTVLMKVMSNGGYDVFVITYATTLVGWILLLYVPILRRGELRSIGKSDKIAVLGGAVTSFAGSFFHILAIANTYTSYATAVRRLDAVISVVLGWRYLKERHILIKLVGSMVMTLGAVLLAVS